MSIIPHKRCPRCDQTKTASEFYKCKRAKTGLATYCKDCVSEYRHANREQIRKHKLEYREANREQIREQRRGYRQANRDKIRGWNREYEQANRERLREYTREYQREYHVANRERIREQRREYRRANWERDRELYRKYRQANPHIGIAIKLRRRARKRGLPDTFTAEQWQYALDYFNGCCAICGRQLKDLFGTHTAAADHWIPLSSEDCPGTVVENMLPLCHGLDGCNSRKGAKLPDEWLTQHFGKRKTKQIMTRIQRYFEVVKE